MPEHWPLTLLLAGYPVWWLLGLDSFLPLALAVPMLHQLLKRRRVVYPPGFGWWLFFLLWVALGGALLWVDAPGAVPGGDASRLMVFGFRLCWYAACAVVLVWVTNLGPSVSERTVHRLIAWIFVVCVAGGLFGLAAPTFELRSVTELLLPGSIRGNDFVASLVHPQAADVQGVLGRPEVRPKAPFPFTNTWGSCLSLSLVFFVIVLRGEGARTRALGAVVLVVAAIPVVYSLNRGLWASIGLGMAGLVLLAVLRSSRLAVLGLGLGTALALVLFVVSPLGSLYQERLDHQHSNDRRAQLLETTLSSVTQGSPVLGFGTTRDVEGSFASIAGGATPDCPACGVPPLGTQGQLWLVVFSQGWLGLAFFLIFVIGSLARSWRCRSPSQTAATFVIAFFVLQLPIYDTLGLPLYLMMIAIGLVAREHRAALPPSAPPTNRVAAGRGTVLLALLLPSALGTTAGVLVSRIDRADSYSSRVSILITPAPVYLDTGSTADTGRLTVAPAPREVTVDTEAALLKSQGTLSRAARRSDSTAVELRSGVTVTAPPNSQVLEVTVRATTALKADSAATEVAEAYLRTRGTYLEKRRDEALAALRDQLRTMGTGSTRLTAARELLSERIIHLLVSRPSIGEVIRQSPAEKIGAQAIVPISSGFALGLLVGILWRRRLVLRSLSADTSIHPFNAAHRSPP